MHIQLASPTDVAGFRAESSRLLAHQVATEQIEWHAGQRTRDEGNSFVATPGRCVLCRCGRLLCGPCVDAGHRPAGDDDAGWLQVARGFAAAETT